MMSHLGLQCGSPETCSGAVHVCDTAFETLGVVRAEGVASAEWIRTAPPFIQQWFGRLDLRRLRSIDFVCPVEGAEAEIQDGLRQAGFRPGAGLDWLMADIAAAVVRHAALLNRDDVRVRADVIDDDACRRFHADYVKARAICTYVGPATEWLDDDAARALAAGVPVAELPIGRFGTANWVVMKGRTWSPDAPRVHRSPPVAHSGVARFVVTLDEPVVQFRT